MARSVGERVFRGEATNRMHPATMHGAYLSGAREAAKAHEALKRLGKEESSGVSSSRRASDERNRR